MTDGSDARRYETDQGVYLIRDVKDEIGWFTGCEYAVKAQDGSDMWKPCIEGVLLADIEPYEARA